MCFYFCVTEQLLAVLMGKHLHLYPFDQENHVCVVITEPLISPLSAFPGKRSREAREALESGTEPQKKRQKEEKKTEQDVSSSSTSIQR